MTSGVERIAAHAKLASTELHALLHWWMAQLKDLSAGSLRWATEQSSRQLTLSIRDEICFHSEDGTLVAQMPWAELEAPNALDLLMQAGLPRRARPRILLPARELLLCPLRLPLLRESDLSAAVELQLERKLPLPRGLVYVDWRAQRDGAQASMAVTVAVVRRASIDRLAAAVRAWGWRVAEVDVQDHPGWRLLPETSAVLHFSVQPRDRWLIGALTLLGIALAATVVGQWAYERSSLGEELALAREQQTRVTSQSRTVAQEGAPLLLLRRVMAASDAIAVLQAITDVTPVDSWVYRTQINAPIQGERGLTISGYAPAPQGWIEALERHPALERVELINTATGSEMAATSRVELKALLPAISIMPGDAHAPR